MEQKHASNYNSRKETDRTIVGMAFFGTIGATIGSTLTSMIAYFKMIPFNREVMNNTKADILGRGGIGAGLAESGSIASGLGSHVIEEAHRLTLIQKPEYSFAKKVIQLGGQKTVAYAGGIIGAILMVGAYFAFRSKTPQQPAGIDNLVLDPASLLVRDREQGRSDHAPQHSKNWQDTVNKEAAAKEVATEKGLSA